MLSRTSTWKVASLSLVPALLFGAGCKGKEKPAPAPAVSAPPAAPKIIVDPKLAARVQQLAQDCAVDVERGMFGQCTSPEAQTLLDDLRVGKLDRVQALPTLAELLSTADEKLQSVLATLLYQSFRSLGEVKKGDVLPVVAERLIASLGKLPERQATQVAPVTVHAAFLSGQSDSLYAALRKTPARVQREAYRHLMTHGGMDAFPLVKELAKSTELVDALNAVEAARRFNPATPEGEKEVCDWAQTLLADPRTQIAGKAGAVLVECKGTYVDALIADAEQRLKNHSFDAAYARAFSYVCTRRGILTGPESAEEQCVKIRGILEGVLKDKQIADAVRVPVVMDLARQWPDAQTKRLIAPYKQSKSRQLQLRAQESDKMIDELKAREREQKAAEAKQGAKGKAVVSPTPKSGGEPAGAKPPGGTP